jgi:hypothetical protein
MQQQRNGVLVHEPPNRYLVCGYLNCFVGHGVPKRKTIPLKQGRKWVPSAFTTVPSFLVEMGVSIFFWASLKPQSF